MSVIRSETLREGREDDLQVAGEDGERMEIRRINKGAIASFRFRK